MPRFFISNPEKSIYNGKITIDGEDAIHISRSLRMKVGEKITVSDFYGKEYSCEISMFTPDSVILDILSEKMCESEPNVKVKIFQALPKGDKMDTVIQKCTELGACEFIPVITSRCISRPDSKSAAKKCERWQKIASEAAKQCGRGIIPTVFPLTEFDVALDKMAECDLAVMCYECEDGFSLKAYIEKAISNGKIEINSKVPVTFSVFIGPEGGISPHEAQSAKELGINLVGLGKRILRTETAPLFAVSAIMLLSGNTD